METIIILGGGESGWGSALLAKKEGFGVFLSDSGMLSPKYRDALADAGIGFEEGGHDKVYGFTPKEVIKSPGIPETAEVVRFFIDKAVPVISEIEFAGRYSRGRTICITGSNGKTTTATLTYEILKEAGYDVALSGNIGQSYAAQVALCDKQWYVLEVSSFQLDGTATFRAEIAVLMNITPDHLDRYGHQFSNYAASKMRVTTTQLAENILIYNACDKTIIHRPELERSAAGKMPFTVCGKDDKYTPFDDPTRIVGSPIKGAAYLEDGVVNILAAGRSIVMPADEIGLKGRHNISNAMASSLAALAAGVDAETICRVLKSFRGVEHRMEDAGELNGVRFVNDSKATNTDAAWFALEGTPGPVVWIAGGTDKGNDYRELKKLAAGRVRALVCMGADNSKLVREFTGVVPGIFDTGSLDEAMEAAVKVAEPGDTVLLSPACASFDLFRNYEQRGTLFKEWVEHRRSKTTDK